MSEVTFRDFAGAVMAKDTAAAARVLKELLRLDDASAQAAAEHFDRQMTQGGPPFMGKAMGLRAAVTTGTDEEIRALIGECFGLEGEAAEGAVGALRERYPRA